MVDVNLRTRLTAVVSEDVGVDDGLRLLKVFVYEVVGRCEVAHFKRVLSGTVAEEQVSLHAFLFVRAQVLFVLVELALGLGNMLSGVYLP